MFDKIWKEQISQTKGKLGIWKPKEELKPREEEDNNCIKRLTAVLDREIRINLGAHNGWEFEYFDWRDDNPHTIDSITEEEACAIIDLAEEKKFDVEEYGFGFESQGQNRWPKGDIDLRIELISLHKYARPEEGEKIGLMVFSRIKGPKKIIIWIKLTILEKLSQKLERRLKMDGHTAETSIEEDMVVWINEIAEA